MFGCNNCPPNTSRTENVNNTNAVSIKNAVNPSSATPQFKSLASLFIPKIRNSYNKGYDSVVLIYPNSKLRQIINNLQSYATFNDALNYCRVQVQLFISNTAYYRSTKMINGKKTIISDGCVSNGKSFDQILNKLKIDDFYNYCNGYNLTNSKINATSSLLLKL